MRACEKITEGCINAWCWPLDQALKLDNRTLRTVAVFPAFLCIFPIMLVLFLPFMLCGGPLDMIEFAWRGEKT
jgi:hypothetical protein